MKEIINLYLYIIYFFIKNINFKFIYPLTSKIIFNLYIEQKIY